MFIEWHNLSGNSILIPSERPKAIVHFIGGAFVGIIPNLSYRWLLEHLSQQGYLVIATPFRNIFDHLKIAQNLLNSFEQILEHLTVTKKIETKDLPNYGIGHSMGCKLHLLICTQFNVKRTGNILISFNNSAANEAIPFGKYLPIAEFIPTPRETQNLILKSYQTPFNCLIKFDNDRIDRTASLIPVLQRRFPDTTYILTLPGNHLTPLSQDLKWYPRKGLPLSQFVRWLDLQLSYDLYRLNRKIISWLDFF
ncbi:MAG: DUF1350 family protein [Prochloraceae cyanobacterium]|nr:DUF1350 family protein [Prochloraceae cyanobacterium]